MVADYFQLTTIDYPQPGYTAIDNNSDDKSDFGDKDWYKKQQNGSNEFKYWNRYRKYLEKFEKFKTPVTDNIDITTNAILQRCGDPNSDKKIDKKGLVVGYVQSGKTGNFIGVVNKAIDCGYKVIIILGGIHDDLRNQTQERMDLGVTGVDTRANTAENFGVSKICKIKSPACESYTHYQKDYKKRGTSILYLDKVSIFVVKKNKSILATLIEDLEQCVKQNPKFSTHKGKGINNKFPLLVIDDEADQASLSIKWKEDNDPNYEPSAINLKIRTLLNLFYNKSFIGYTATPFGNIFANPFADDEKLGGDLFPKDFIIMLKRPNNYMGPVEIFGIVDHKGVEKPSLPVTRIIDDYRDEDFAKKHTIKKGDSLFGSKSKFKGYKENIFDIIRWNNIPSDSVKEIDTFFRNNIGLDLFVGEGFVPAKHLKEYNPYTRLSEVDKLKPIDLPLSLKTAIFSFLLSCAGRLLRGDNEKHFTMLIHVTRFTLVQDNLGKIIKEYLTNIFNLIKVRNKPTLKVLKDLWEKDFMPTSKEMSQKVDPYKYFIGRVNTWEEVLPFLMKVPGILSSDDDTNDPRVRVIHGGSDSEKLDYPDYEKTGGLKVIAIGGNKLSRGLTLEGLMTSYYSRSSNFFDTLMQMGRWFGYRKGYPDLCRIFTSEELHQNYRAIAEAFEELKILFDEMYFDPNASPINFGLRVRAHPRLMITNSLKLGKAQTLDLDFNASLAQTTILFNNADKVKKNIEVCEALFKKIGNKKTAKLRKLKNTNIPIWSNIKSTNIVDFLTNFKTHSNSSKTRAKSLAEYIEIMNKKDELKNWSVIIYGVDQKKRKEIEFSDWKIKPVTRGATDAKKNDFISIKVLTDHKELYWDFTDKEIGAFELEWEKLKDPDSSGNKRGTFEAFVRYKKREVNNGLLIIYPVVIEKKNIKPKSEDIDAVNGITKNKWNGMFNVGFGVVFPNSKKSAKIRYKLNEIEIMKLKQEEGKL